MINKKPNFGNILILISALTAYMALGFYLSWHSIPNQLGYFEISWNLIYLDFKKAILSPTVTPLIFIVSMVIHKLTNISLANSWKLMDLFFSGLVMIFLTYLYWDMHAPKKFAGKIAPIILIFTSLGFLYSFTSMSGEGIPIFFAMTGAYLWYKKKYELAALLFSVSYLSKYTMYLVAPGLLFWTIVNFHKFAKREVIRIVLSGLFLMSVAILYLSFKNWGDLKLQAPYVDDFSVTSAAYQFPYFFVTFVIGAPIVGIFYFLRPSFNIFWLMTLSALLMLTRRYFYWNHVQQIIVFAMAYFMTHRLAPKFLEFRPLSLQLVFTVCLLAILPIYSSTQPLFFKHMTYDESRIIEKEIVKDYRGGKIGYYLNRPFDEPFPSYEISYNNPVLDHLIRETEYIIVPTIYGIPPQLLGHIQDCNYVFKSSIGRNTIYRINCSEKNKQE